MELTRQRKHSIAINAVLVAIFLALVAYMTATGLIWRVPHYLQVIELFSAGVIAAVWVRHIQNGFKD